MIIVIENWCALFIATQFEISPEQAFETFWKGKLPRKNLNITKEDELEMRKLRLKGMKYKDIGVMYGLSKDAVYRRLNRIEKKGEN